MATPTTLIGILAKLYYNTASYGSPTWAPISLVGDLNIPQTWDAADVVIRGSRMKFKAKTALGVTITGKLLASLTDTAYLAVMAAMNNDDVLDLLALTAGNDVNGARGYRFDAQVFAATQDQGPTGVMWNDFELAPALTVNPPKWALVASGAPVLTAF